jgi:Fe-S oxidoreductase
MGDGADSQAWLFLGCQGSRQDPGPARAALALARARFGKVHVPTGLGCCGHPLWRWGARQGFAQRAQLVSKSLAGVRWLVVDDPGCAYALRVLYPKIGVAVPEIVTTTQLLTVSPWRLPAGGPWAPHDNCFGARYLNEPCLRCWLAAQGSMLAAGSVLEAEAGCCGGDLLPFYDPLLARKVVQDHLRDLLASGAKRILTASPTCRRQLRKAGALVDDVTELWLRSQSGVVKTLVEEAS